MSSSNSNSNSNSAGAPRIQISLNKQNLAKPPSSTDATTTTTTSSSIEAMISSTPGLYKSVRKALKNQTLNFKINTECTSLKVSPSGNFLWGGFSDGTLRVWDLSGTFGVEDDDVVASRQKSNLLVNSKLTQGYGAVACQIHARGVHTDLLATVDISDDAQYVFMGVSRGAMELHAVFIGDLERAVHKHKETTLGERTIHRNILDYIKVYCHSDAKLKGFGACAMVKNNNNNNKDASYLLLTGKGIKNIHIWKFVPPKHPNYDFENPTKTSSRNRNRLQSICDPPEDEQDHGEWEQLYDTSTNGNTIVLLGFYRTPQQKLLAVSKSDAQKLRLWDLSFEESPSSTSKDRPKRPPYEDVENSQAALDIAGGIGVCGGGNMYNEMSIVSLDRPKDPFNHTELALPSGGSGDPPGGGYSSRRQRRGEMKAVVNVATCQRDSSHALLELDDGTLVGYSAGSTSSSNGGSIPKLAMVTPERTGIPSVPADFWRRCICLANISGVVIAASSLYNPNTNKGQLVIRALGGLKKPRGSEIKKKRKLLKQLQQQPPPPPEEPNDVEKPQAVAVTPKTLPPPADKDVVAEQKKKKLELKLLKQHQQNFVSNEQIVAAPPKTPSPIHTGSLQSSPMAADAEALKDAVSGPKAVPVSAIRPSSSEATPCQTTRVVGEISTRVSPGTLETPRDPQKVSTETVDESSPDSVEKLPKISQFLQPRNIDRQEPPQETKKRKAAATAPVAAATTPSATAPKNSDSPVAMFQLNNIGSIPFNSPKPVAKKAKKSSIVKAPSKPKKPSSSNSTVVAEDSKLKEKKRNRSEPEAGRSESSVAKMARTSDDVSTALLLTSLASQQSPTSLPQPMVQATPNISSKPISTLTPKVATMVAKPKPIVAKTNTKSKTEASKPTAVITAIPKVAAKSVAKTASKSKSVAAVSQEKQQSPEVSSREAILNEKINEQYKQLKTFLKNFTAQSISLIHSRNLRGPVPSALRGAMESDRQHLDAYSKLLEEHRASHDYLQRRLLKAAETTLLLLKEARITSEEARTELKQSIKKFEGILYDTLHRQQMERMALVAKHPNSVENFKMSRQSSSSSLSTKDSASKSNYPCRAAFDKVEDICAAITRPVGRPRSAAASATLR